MKTACHTPKPAPNAGIDPAAILRATEDTSLHLEFVLADNDDAASSELGRL
jgi:hypothetical protein